MSMFNLAVSAFEITWDPGLRGILVVLIGITVLMGSIYALLSTNVGARVGILVAVAGLSGWMLLMGIVWAIYGIGYKGPIPSWKVEEMVVSTSSTDLDSARLDAAHDLSTWKELAADDPRRGEAQAAASAALVAAGSPAAELYKTEADFKVVDAFDKGGKTKNLFNNWVPGPHPVHYSIIQVQGVKAVEVPFGAAPPPAEVDPSKDVVSVILVRDLGALRLPSVSLVIFSGIIFGVTCNALHRRDKAVAAARAAATATA
jgi:hypothetical protein